MMHDDSRPSPAEQLAAINAAPDLSRPAPVGERIAGLATLAVLYGGLVVAMQADLPQLAGVGVYVAALALVLTWSGHQRGAARRRPHTRVEKRAQFCSSVLLAIPGINLIFDNGPDTLVGHLVTAAIPAAAAAVYLTLRWRR